MRSTQSLKRGLEAVRRLAKMRHFERAFVKIDQLLKQWPDNPEVLVAWANLLQLQDADVGPPLEEARAALQRAVELDEQAPMPLIELGQYLFALEDDTRAASRCFTKAIALSRSLLKEALLAESKALAELGRRSEALACLAEAYWLSSRSAKTAGNGRDEEEILTQLQELAPAD
jgi:tetratricopeptide (TPR) repeat protein